MTSKLSKRVLETAENVQKTTQYYNQKRAEVDAIWASVLEVHPIFVAEKLIERELPNAGERILDHNLLYQAKDEDFQFVWDKVRAISINTGVHPTPLDYEACPALVADTRKINAEKEFVRAVAGYLGEDEEEFLQALIGKHLFDLYPEFIDTGLKMVEAYKRENNL